MQLDITWKISFSEQKRKRFGMDYNQKNLKASLFTFGELQMSENNSLPLHSPEDVDLKIFNAIKSPDYNNGKPIKDIRRLFYKQVILDDETILSVETIKIPGYIGIACLYLRLPQRCLR
jgi:hypothetical protein